MDEQRQSACADCEQTTKDSTPKTASTSPDPLDASSFVPPALDQELPRVVIEYCDRCRWQHRATWVSTELLLTFPTTSSTGLRSISLVPRTNEDTGGRFRVWLYREQTMEEQFEAEVVQGRTAWNGAELVWDRKIEGGFPELKELKQRIRNLIAPSQDLGHSDKKSESKIQASTPPDAVSTTDGGDLDYTPRFKC